MHTGNSAVGLDPLLSSSVRSAVVATCMVRGLVMAVVSMVGGTVVFTRVAIGVNLESTASVMGVGLSTPSLLNDFGPRSPKEPPGSMAK